MCQECKERWVASHGGNSSPMPVFPECEDCKKAQVTMHGWPGLTIGDCVGNVWLWLTVPMSDQDWQWVTMLARGGKTIIYNDRWLWLTMGDFDWQQCVTRNNNEWLMINNMWLWLTTTHDYDLKRVAMIDNEWLLFTGGTRVGTLPSLSEDSEGGRQGSYFRCFQIAYVFMIFTLISNHIHRNMIPGAGKWGEKIPPGLLPALCNVQHHQQQKCLTHGIKINHPLKTFCQLS